MGTIDQTIEAKKINIAKDRQDEIRKLDSKELNKEIQVWIQHIEKVQ